MSTLRWGILGTGTIAKTFTQGLQSAGSTLAAVGSRSPVTAQAFAEGYAPQARCHGSYESLLADPEVDIVYISTPHPDHGRWTIAAARAGKHILCEKPLTLNDTQAMTVIDTMRGAGVFLMEAFMYRAHPQTLRLIELIRAKAIGDVKYITGSFGFHAPFDPKHRLFANELAGGGIMDVGCYPVSMSRLIAGVALGRDVAEPVEVMGAGHVGETGVDEYAAATLRFEGDIVAQVSAGVRLNMHDTLRVFGTAGHLEVPAPWIPAREGGISRIILHRDGQPSETIEVEAKLHLYAYEIQAVTRAIASGAKEAAPPCMTWADTLGNMRTLTRWRKALGVHYAGEQ